MATCRSPVWEKPRLVSYASAPGDLVSFKIYADALSPEQSTRRVIGRTQLCLDDMPFGQKFTRLVELDPLCGDVSTGSCEIVVSRLPEATPAKSLFFIRHAESKWNEAQKNLYVSQLLGAYDHGLTLRGCKQVRTNPFCPVR